MVPTNDERKKFKCIEWMEEENYAIWHELKNYYYDRLQGGAIRKNIAYTLHDYEHHCKNIYKIIGRLLNIKNEMFLSQDELLVLNLAVLLHDISMTETKDVRWNHSKVSAELVMQDAVQGVSAWKKVDTSLVESICLIIQAHSDVKEQRNGKEVILEHTLENSDLTDSMSSSVDTDCIHAKFLAGVLRLADELDITRERVDRNDKRYQDLDVTDEEQCRSKECWEQLLYFKDVIRDKANIKIVVDEEHLKKIIVDDRMNIKIRIEKVLKKVRDTLAYVNKHAIEKSDDLYEKLHVQHVIIRDNNLFQQEGWDFSEEKNHGNTQRENNQKKGAKESANIEVLNPDLQEKITKFIYEKDLIISGHFKMNKNYCGEDWIDVRSVVSDRVLGAEITDVVKEDIKDVMDAKKATKLDTIVVGIGMNGNILAAKIAHYLKLPFTYVLRKEEDSHIDNSEIIAEIDRFKHVILITGVVSTYDTVLQICSQYKLTEKVIKIYTVLYRTVKELESTSEIKILKKIMSSLCNDFNSKIIDRKNCMKDKYNSCMAKNMEW